MERYITLDIKGSTKEDVKKVFLFLMRDGLTSLSENGMEHTTFIGGGPEEVNGQFEMSIGLKITGC